MILLFCLLLLFLTPSARAAESITQFNSAITINQDTSITVEETIEYKTDESKRGIIRYVPYRYQINGLNYSTDIELLSVTDADGQAYQVQATTEAGNLNWRIGDPDVYFTGTKTYVIRYSIEDVLQRFDGYDELYLDITGEGWQFPIESTSALVTSPYARITRVACYGGEFGTDDGTCQVEQISDSQVRLAYASSIEYGENVTLVVGLDPNNQLAFPTLFERRLKWLRDNLWLGFVPLPLITMFYIWYTRGRDEIFISANIFDMTAKPTQSRPVFGHERMPIVYQPLQDLTPGEAGAIIDEQVDNRDIVAELIDLARKKYLEIKPITKGKSIFKTKDYQFIKLKDADDSLPKHQQYLHERLFINKTEIKLSELKGTFHTHMSRTRELIYDATKDKQLFTQQPMKQMLTYGSMSVALIVILMILSFFVWEESLPASWLALGLQFIAVPFFAKGMIRKTPQGYNYYMQAKGLRETIKRGAWREKIHERQLFFDEVLPFAIAFNVVDQLAKDMQDLNVEAPSYLAASGWHTATLMKSLNHFGDATTKSLAYNPSSSSAGGSGFSGGSSGGGFGGGGGGSW